MFTAKEMELINQWKEISKEDKKELESRGINNMQVKVFTHEFWYNVGEINGKTLWSRTFRNLSNPKMLKIENLVELNRSSKDVAKVDVYLDDGEMVARHYTFKA